MIDEKRLIEEIDGKVAGLTNIQMMQIADIIASQQKVGECDRDCKDCWKTKFVNIVKPKEHADGWIPCSERLPSEDCYCLITTSDSEIDVREYNYSKGWGWDGFERVIAWQPLPEAWKGE